MEPLQAYVRQLRHANPTTRTGRSDRRDADPGTLDDDVDGQGDGSSARRAGVVMKAAGVQMGGDEMLDNALRTRRFKGAEFRKSNEAVRNQATKSTRRPKDKV